MLFSRHITLTAIHLQFISLCERMTVWKAHDSCAEISETTGTADRRRTCRAGSLGNRNDEESYTPVKSIGEDPGHHMHL